MGGGRSFCEGSKLREAGLRLPILALQAGGKGKGRGPGAETVCRLCSRLEEAADYRSLRAEIRGPSGSPFEGHSFGLQLPGCVRLRPAALGSSDSSSVASAR